MYITHMFQGFLIGKKFDLVFMILSSLMIW